MRYWTHIRACAVVVIVLLCGASAAYAAVALDATGTAQTGSGTSVDIPITIGVSANMVILVEWNGTVDTTGIAANITGGETLSVISGTDGGATTGTVMLGVVTTKSGAQTVHVSWTNSQTFIVNATTYSGAQGFTGGTTGAATSPSPIAITSTAGDLTVSLSSILGASAATTDQTAGWTKTDGSSFFTSAIDRGPGTGTTTHTWTGTGTIWLSGVNVAQVTSTDTTPPSTPSNPNTSSVTSEGMSITWGASTDNVGVTAYDLQRCSGAGCSSFAQIATPTTTSYPDSGLAGATSYTYRMRARDAAGNTSTFSTANSTNTLASTSRTLNWTANAPLTQDSFAVYRCVTTSSSCVPGLTAYATVASSARSYVDTISANPTSCYQVRALLAGTAGSGLSNIACAAGGAIRLTISVAGTGSGITAPTIGTTTYTNGTVVGLTVTPNPTSDFVSWSGDADCTDGSVTLNTSTACTANITAQAGTFAYLGNRGYMATRNLTNTITATVATTSQKNNMVVVRAVTDNISATSGQTGDHIRVTDSLGNQYVKLGEQTRSAGSAFSGVTVSLWASRLFSSLTSSNTVTLTTSTATIANALTVEEYALAASTTFTNASTTGTNGASASPSAVISGLSSAVRLFLAALGVETAGSASATSSNTYGDGTWVQSHDYASGTTTNATTGSATSANVVSFYGTLRASGSTGNTYSPALAIGTSPNWALLFSSLSTAVSVNSHPLTLATTGAGNGTVTGAGTYYEGSVVQIQAIPDASSAFAGWVTTVGSNCTSPTNPTVSVTLNLDTICTASFSVPNVVLPNRVLTLASAGTGTGTTMGAGTYPDGTVVTITATPAANSFFAGWTPAACSSGSVTMTADITCTATFTLLPSVTLTVNTTGTGLGAVTGAGTYTQGANATLTAVPNVGSIFTGWTGSAGCTGTTSPLTLLMDSTKTCTATFTLFTGQGPTGSILAQPYKRCTVSYVLAFTSTLTISNVVWSVDGVRTMSQNPGGQMTQTVAPFIFQKSLVKDGSSVTAVATDAAGQSATLGPTVVACP